MTMKNMSEMEGVSIALTLGILGMSHQMSCSRVWIFDADIRGTGGKISALRTLILRLGLKIFYSLDDAALLVKEYGIERGLPEEKDTLAQEIAATRTGACQFFFINPLYRRFFCTRRSPPSS